MVERAVILLSGNEHFLKEEALARIKSAFLDKNSGDFNFNVFYGGSAQIEKILECATTQPFLGPKRVVLLRQSERLSPPEQKLILSYVKNPQSQTSFILETRETNIGRGFFAEISKAARVIFCNPLQGRELFSWIRRLVQEKAKKIEEGALRLLVKNLGNNLQLISNALDNLVLYIGQRQAIGASDVQVLVGPDLETSAFKLFDAVQDGDKQKAWQILDSLFKDGVNSAQILGALAHKIISEKGRLDASFFERSLQDLQQADADIKTGRQNQRLALELLLTRLLGLF